MLKLAKKIKFRAFINFKPQNCHFDHLAALNFEFWEILTFSSMIFFQKSKVKDSKIVKIAVFDLSHQPKLISRKIIGARKMPKFTH